MPNRRELLALGLASGLALLARAQQPRRVCLRGTLESLSGATLVLRQRNGDRTELALAPDLAVTEVYPVTLDYVRPGAFIGVGAMPQPESRTAMKT